MFRSVLAIFATFLTFAAPPQSDTGIVADDAVRLADMLSQNWDGSATVVLIASGNVDGVEAALEARGITPNVIKEERRPTFYAPKLVHRMHRHGRLWLIFDRSNNRLREYLRSTFLKEYEIDRDERFGHLALLEIMARLSEQAKVKNRVQLDHIATTNYAVTDIQFLPEDAGMLIATQHGQVQWLPSGVSAIERVVLDLPKTLETGAELNISSESGLIGLALHPMFPITPKLYLHYNHIAPDGTMAARIDEWMVEVSDLAKGEIRPVRRRPIIEIPQRYDVHNGGQLAFGGDGFLYIAVGDGALSGDRVPGKGLRGRILRIDVTEAVADNKMYGIPDDNPFVGNDGISSESWAIGFRNPWRMSFTPDGRLVVSDVGKADREEINIVEPGRDYGWPFMEGTLCHDETICETMALTRPILDYGRELGFSITGGNIYEGRTISWLRGKFVFADFTSGRLWAIDLPTGRQPVALNNFMELGRWTVEITAFGKSPAGELYVGDLRGGIYKLVPNEN